MRQTPKKIARAGVVGALMAFALAGFLLLSVESAFAQAPPAGTWQDMKQNTKGTWKRLKNEAGDYYKASPNLQTGVERVQTVLSIIADAGSGEALPPGIGEVVGVLSNSPEYTKVALRSWLDNKIRDAMAAGDQRREDRYNAFRACVDGDCSALHALLRKQTETVGQRTGQPLRIVITSVVAFPSVIKEGESARITVSARTIVGGEVVITLQPQGFPIGALTKVKPDAAPGETVTFTFDQGFEKAGKFSLLALARDSRSDDSEYGYITVTKKAAPPPPPPPPQENSGNSGKFTGDGLEIEWSVSGADVGKRAFSERTWQAGGVQTAPMVRFQGVMRASVPPRLVTDSSMGAYISLGMGAGKKEVKWGGPLGGDHGLSHELPFDLSLDVPPGATVLVSASVNKVGGVADVLGLFFQFPPAPRAK